MALTAEEAGDLADAMGAPRTPISQLPQETLEQVIEMECKREIEKAAQSGKKTVQVSMRKYEDNADYIAAKAAVGSSLSGDGYSLSDSTVQVLRGLSLKTINVVEINW